MAVVPIFIHKHFEKLVFLMISEHFCGNIGIKGLILLFISL